MTDPRNLAAFPMEGYAEGTSKRELGAFILFASGTRSMMGAVLEADNLLKHLEETKPKETERTYPCASCGKSREQCQCDLPF